MIQDNCGVFGLASSHDNIIDDLYLGTFYLQHRGQRYCGLSVKEDNRIKIRTHKGLIRETFSHDLGGMEGKTGIGHASLKDRQPVKLNSKLGEFTICFSGFVINSEKLVEEFMKEGHTFYTDSDVEILGDKFVKAVKVESEGKVREIAVEGIFVEIGLIPNSSFVDFVEKNKYGEIIINCAAETSVAGIFAAGDVTNVPEKQIIVAAGDGSKASLAAFGYLSRH